MQTVPNHHFIAHFPSHSQDKHFFPTNLSLFPPPPILKIIPIFPNPPIFKCYIPCPIPKILSFSKEQDFLSFHPIPITPLLLGGSHSQDGRFTILPFLCSPLWRHALPPFHFIPMSIIPLPSHSIKIPTLIFKKNLNHLTPILKICGSDSHRQNNFTPSPTPPLKPPPP